MKAATRASGWLGTTVLLNLAIIDSPFGHGDTGHKHALVFVGDERRRQNFVADAHKARDQDEEDSGIFQMTDHPADFPRVAVLEMIENPVEPAEEGTQRPGLDGLIIGLQENTA